MFEDILNQRHSIYVQGEDLRQQSLIDRHRQVSNDFEVVTVHCGCENMHISILNRQSTEEMNSLIVKVQKQLNQKKKRIRKYTSNNPNNKRGHWTNEQNFKYHFFLELNAKYFIDSQRRKTDKIFKSMSCFIQTREPYQCRSHHQKIQKKWRSVPNILLNLRLQNFNQTKNLSLKTQLQKLGYRVHDILQQDDLKNQEQLLKRIIQQKLCQNPYSQQHEYQGDNQAVDNLLGPQKFNFMSLMMSEKYEDHLNI